MAGTAITSSSLGSAIATGPLINGKSTRLCWWNASAARWDGLVAKEDSVSNDDWYIVKDIGGTETYDLELEDRNSARPTIYWDAANEKLSVVATHGTTGQWEFWQVTYTSGTDTYSVTTGAERLGINIPGMARSAGGEEEPIGLTVTPNGHIWVFSMLDGNSLDMQHSSNNGANWETGVTALQTGLTHGCVDAHWFANGGTNYVCVYGTENGGASAEDYFFFIDEDHSTPTTAGNWTDDSANIPAYDASQEADDHCCMAKDSNENIFIVCKRQGTGENDIKLLKRTPSGTWSVSEVWASASNRTRPAIAIKKKDASTDEEIIIAAGVITTSPIVAYKTSDVGTISFSGETTLFEDTVGSDNFFDTFAPCKGTVYDSSSGIMFFAENNDDQLFWQNSLSITAPAVSWTIDVPPAGTPY